MGLLVAGFLVFSRFSAIHPSAAAAATAATAATAGPAPTMCAPPGQMALASGLGLDESCVSDEDLDPNNAPVDDDADIDCVTVIDACGNATPLCDDWESWAPTEPGVYLMLVTLDDAANYADDPPVTYQFTFEVGDDTSCTSCNGGSTRVPTTAVGIGGTVLLHSVDLRFSLGTATDGEPAGLLRVSEEQPSVALATPAKLKYDLVRSDVEVIKDGSNHLRQILTPQLLADIITIDSYEYHVRFFALADVGAKDGNGYYQVTSGDEFKRWEIANPDGASAYDRLFVAEFVDDGAGGLVERIRYEYDGAVGSSDWTLTTKDTQGATLRVETVEWVTLSNDPQGRARRERQYVVTDSGSNETYREYEQYTQFGWGWRRTQRRVDPNGADLTTTWTWKNESSVGLVLESVQRPDGSWTWYNIGPVQGGDWVVEQISGWKDATYPSSLPSPSSSSVRAVTLTYDGSQSYRLASVREQAAGNLVRAADYTHTYNGSTLLSTLEERWQDTSGSSTLDATWGYWNGDQKRIDYVNYPDSRRDDFDYDDVISFTPGSPPGTPPSYNLGGSDPDYRYREVVRGVNSGGSTSLVDGKSTKRTVIIDASGLPLFEETWAYAGSSWTRIGWTARVYDGQARLTDVYRHDGTYETIDYSSCCGRVVTDAGGVTTQYENDLLGRIATITRYQVASYGSYAAQPAITTTYDYSEPLEETVTVSAGSGQSQVTQTTVRTFDGAQRITSVTTGSGDGALKTLYEYGTGSGGGRKVTVYRDYASSATQGSSGVRDQISEYYRDGRVKSVTGSTVFGSYYDYGSQSNGQLWTLAATGSSLSSPRYEKSFYDMLRRTDHVERPGWASSGSATLTTTYHYDGASGRLLRVETPAQADTLYDYDALGSVEFTALDVNDSGEIELDEDRVTRSETKFEQDGGAWWRVARGWVYPIDDDDTAVPTGSQWSRLTGLGSGLIRETRSIDTSDNVTTSTTVLDRTNALVTETTTLPDSSQDAERITHGGRLMETTGKSGINTVYAYDAIGRQTQVTDGRGNTTQTSYDASGRVAWVKDGALNQTDYSYYAASESGTGVYPGRLKYVENPADKRSYFGYNDRSQIIRTWGHVPNPTENVYDGYGQRTTLKTFRGGSGWDGSTWPGSPGDSDDTSWTFHEATGLLNQKTYDDGTSIGYTYTSDGKLYTRKWARNASDGKVTTYTYDADTGELTDVDYDAAWSMTDLAYTYDRLGRRKTVTDAAGTRTFAYDPDTLQPTTETFNSGLFSGKIITQVYQDGTGGTLAGRWAGVQIGSSGDPDADYAASYGFDTYGRLNHVAGPGLPTGDGTNNGAWYSFVSGSELVDKLLFKNSSATVKGWVDWSYEDDRDLVTAVENSFGDLSTYTTISKYAYGNDSRGRREHVVRTGSAFASSHMDLWQYNDRNELTRSERHAGTDPNSPGTEDTSLRRVYAYDPIGNRSTSTEGTGAQTTYTSNNLNQYDPVVTATSPQTGQRLKYDLDGNLTEAFVTGDINGDGNVDMSDLGALLAAYGTCEGQQGYNANANIVPNDPGPQCVDSADLGLLLSVYGLQATGAIRAKFTWDAENRLVGWEPLLFVSGAKKVTFAYDYLGRRIEKKVYTYNGSSWNLSETRRFIWNDWLLLLELDGDGNVLRKLTWGRDLSGSLDGAGGIGGLLAIQDTNGTPSSDTDDLRYVYFYDANGNVGQVIDLAAANASASIKAHYEYDAYGKVLVQSGSYAAANPYRFSTKPWDDETGLGYWGQRYYDPRLGRWINHDPIGELGGLNLYAYVRNRPTITIDPIGRQSAISDDAWEGLDEWIFGPIINGTSSAACWTCANAAGANVLLQLRLEGIDGTDDFGGGNAFRHCLATCQTAKACGMSCAKWFWDGRETPGVPADDQDLANNQVGYGCASQDSCWSCCMNAWNNGGLTCRVADPNDPQKRGPCPPRPPFPPPPAPPPKEPTPGPGRRCDM